MGHCSTGWRGFGHLASRFVLGRPLQLEGPLPIFSLIMIPHQVIWRLTDETSPFLFFLSLHSVGHLDLEVTVTSQSFLQEARDKQPLIIFLVSFNRMVVLLVGKRGSRLRGSGIRGLFYRGRKGISFM